MPDLLDLQDTIVEARACLLHAVKIDAGRRAMEGDVEDADNRLDEALEAIQLGDLENARRAVDDARGLLQTRESAAIAVNRDSLVDAVRLLDGISWD
jgi:hypothetical protein